VTGLHRFWPLLLLLLAITLLSSCNDDDDIILPPLDNNELSQEWNGIFTGPGEFLQINADPRIVTGSVQVRDVGDNYIRVSLSLPGVNYSPVVRHEFPVQTRTRARGNVVDESTFYVDLSRSTTRLTGVIRATGIDNRIAWQFSFTDLALEE
jgi:hypothetical protein